MKRKTILFLTLFSFAWSGLTAQTWEAVPIGNGISMNEASCPDANTCYTVGSNGAIYKTTDAGVTWFNVHNVNTTHLSAVSCPNNSTCFALGENGVILRSTTSGQSWNSTTSPKAGTNIYFFDNNTGFISGTGANSIVKTLDGGDYWEEIQTNYAGVIEQVQFFSATEGVALGKEFNQGNQVSSSTVLKTTDGGATWTVLTKVDNVQFMDFHFPSQQFGYISADKGRVYRTNNGGTTWTLSDLGTTLPLHGVHFANNYIGYVAGALGKMYKTLNGGATWMTLSTGKKYQFVDVHFFDADNGLFLVGGNTAVRTTTGGL